MDAPSITIVDSRILHTYWEYQQARRVCDCLINEVSWDDTEFTELRDRIDAFEQTNNITLTWQKSFAVSL